MENDIYKENISNIDQEKQNETRSETVPVEEEKDLVDIEERQENLVHKEGTESVKNLVDKQEVTDEEGLKESEAVAKEEKTEKQDGQDVVEEEEAFVEEPPPDPTAPYNLRDSTEAIKPPFQFRPDQLAEAEELWAIFQNYNPAYTDLDNYITEKELIYMLKSLLLMTYTPEQLQELIDFCVRPSHPQGHITYEQFLKIVTIRQRDLPVEEELRTALQFLDPGKTGTIDREFFKTLLLKQGHKLSPKILDSLIKEVDMSNDGTIGIEDVVGTMGIDLNKDDILMLRAAIFPDENEKKEQDEF